MSNSNQITDRLLQGTPAMTMVTKVSNTASDESKCEHILRASFATDYEASMNPCTCKRFGPGFFLLDCSYDYCEKCLDSTELCGYQYMNYTIVDNFTSAPGFQPTEMNKCIQYTSGKDYNMCIKSVFDGPTSFFLHPQTCQIHIRDQVCTSCDHILCPNGTEFDFSWSFDCSNIEGLYAMNMCDYEPYTDVASPSLDALDPLVFIRYENKQWYNCIFAPNNGSEPSSPLNIMHNFPAFAPSSDSVFDLIDSLIDDTLIDDILIDDTLTVVDVSSSIESAASSLLPLIDTANVDTLFATVMVLFYFV
jgi:hypothetical protein